MTNNPMQTRAALTSFAVPYRSAFQMTTKVVEPFAVSDSGLLALHRPVGGEPGWSISHVPTGWGVIRANIDLDEAMRRLAHLDRLEWRFDQVCQVPAATTRALIELVSLWRCGKPEMSDDFKEVCFAETHHDQ